LSRAGLPAKVLNGAEEILANLRQAERLSRAGLRRRMRREVLKILSEMYRDGENLGQNQPLSRTGLEGQPPVVVGQAP
jgi:DNA mismatch repair ATPase MutS